MDVRAIRFEPVRVSLAELALHRRGVNRKGQADLSADFTIARKIVMRKPQATSLQAARPVVAVTAALIALVPAARFGWDGVVDLKQLCVPSAQATGRAPNPSGFWRRKNGHEENRSTGRVDSFARRLWYRSRRAGLSSSAVQPLREGRPGDGAGARQRGFVGCDASPVKGD
jgi:hypothetical protein